MEVLAKCLMAFIAGALAGFLSFALFAINERED